MIRCEGGQPALVAVDTVPPAVARQAFVEGFRGYPVPVELSETEFSTMVAAEEIDLAASRIALANGAPAGIALIAFRGIDAWCGGLGVAPAWRRAGLGTRLMRELIAEARTHEATRVRLEVIEGNEPARRLYERLGFRPCRRFDIFRGDVEPVPSEPDIGEDDDPEAVWAAFDEFHRARPPWQSALPSLRHRLGGSGEPPRLWLSGRRGTPTAYLIGRRRDDALVVIDAGERTGSSAPGRPLARLVATAAGALGVRTVATGNVPQDDPLTDALRSLGVPVVLRQTEMELTLM